MRAWVVVLAARGKGRGGPRWTGAVDCLCRAVAWCLARPRAVVHFHARLCASTHARPLTTSRAEHELRSPHRCLEMDG